MKPYSRKDERKSSRKEISKELKNYKKITSEEQAFQAIKFQYLEIMNSSSLRLLIDGIFLTLCKRINSKN